MYHTSERTRLVLSEKNNVYRRRKVLQRQSTLYSVEELRIYDTPNTWLKDATAFLFRLSYLRTQREKETRNACKTAGSKVYYMYNIFIRSISCVYMYNIYIYIYIIDRYTNYTLTKIKSFVLLITHRYVRTFFISLTCKMRDKDDDNNKTWIGHMHVAVLSHNFAGTNGFLFFFFP